MAIEKDRAGHFEVFAVFPQFEHGNSNILRTLGEGGVYRSLIRLF